MTQQQLMTALEPLIDATTAGDVLLALARVCDEKAEHVITNWQDRALEKQWLRLARKLDKLGDETEL